MLCFHRRRKPNRGKIVTAKFFALISRDASSYFELKLAEALPLGRDVLSLIAAYSTSAPRRVADFVLKDAGPACVRVLNIADLYAFVRENGPKNEKMKWNPKFAGVDWSALTQPPHPQLRLLGVFDGALFCLFLRRIVARAGRCGKIAADFASQTIAFELAILPEFREGQYADALKKLLPALHNSLLDCPDYVVDKPAEWLASGTTASIALITTSTTVFGFLGDSPIVSVRFPPRYLCSRRTTCKTRIA